MSYIRLRQRETERGNEKVVPVLGRGQNWQSSAQAAPILQQHWALRT